MKKKYTCGAKRPCWLCIADDTINRFDQVIYLVHLQQSSNILWTLCHALLFSHFEFSDADLILNSRFDWLKTFRIIFENTEMCERWNIKHIDKQWK